MIALALFYSHTSLAVALPLNRSVSFRTVLQIFAHCMRPVMTATGWCYITVLRDLLIHCLENATSIRELVCVWDLLFYFCLLSLLLFLFRRTAMRLFTYKDKVIALAILVVTFQRSNLLTKTVISLQRIDYEQFLFLSKVRVKKLSEKKKKLITMLARCAEPWEWSKRNIGDQTQWLSLWSQVFTFLLPHSLADLFRPARRTS